MDDHMYDQIISYAECDLLPRFRKEYNKIGVMKNCDSYKEIKALCIALNAIAPWAGYKKVNPSTFIWEV